jgi:hypothetical protein
MVKLYLRLTDDADAYLRRSARESGLPMATIVDLLLRRAEAEGWTFRREIVKEGER